MLPLALAYLTFLLRCSGLEGPGDGGWAPFCVLTSGLRVPGAYLPPEQRRGHPEAVSLQSTAQPRRFELRERQEVLEPVSQLKVRWWGSDP